MLSKNWTEGGEEPSLNEVMSDPIVELVMARDNLKHDDVWKVVEEAREGLEKTAA